MSSQIYILLYCSLCQRFPRLASGLVGSLEELKLRKAVILVPTVYYSKRLQNKISKGEAYQAGEGLQLCALGRTVRTQFSCCSCDV